MRPVLRRRRPARPELVLLCDVSGSVAGFSNFTMLLVQALHDQFSKVRVFAFVNRVDEVTELIGRDAAEPEGLGARILSEAAADGLARQQRLRRRRWASSPSGTPDAVGPRSTVFVLGDARTNISDPNLGGPARTSPGAPARSTGSTPSGARCGAPATRRPDTYAEIVEMHECRNAQQLSALIARLLPV